MRWRVLGGVLIAVGLSSGALADGLPYSRPAIYEAGFSWTGVYVGGHGGWERKDVKGFDDFLRLPDKQHIDGGFGGGQLGYNHQFGKIVVGTEVSVSLGRISGTDSCFGEFAPHTTTRLTVAETASCHAKEEWTGQWLNRLGLTFSDNRLLVFATGGLAVTNLKINRTNVDTVTIGTAVEIETDTWSGSSRFVGGVIGGGVQYAINQHISLGFEYLHTAYRSNSFSTTGSDTLCFGGSLAPAPCLPASPFTDSAKDRLDTEAVRFVINYKFGGDREYVPLK